MTGQDDLDRADALLDVDRADQAREIIVRVMARDPESVRAACLLASAFRVSEDWARMRAAAERACALAPEHSWAHQLRSVALRGLGHHASAAAAARQAVKLDPENPSALVTLVQALLRPEHRGVQATSPSCRGPRVAPGARA